MISAVFGPVQLLVVLVPILIFIFGYFVGKKSGYIKRVKEEEKKKQ